MGGHKVTRLAWKTRSYYISDDDVMDFIEKKSTAAAAATTFTAAAPELSYSKMSL